MALCISLPKLVSSSSDSSSKYHISCLVIVCVCSCSECKFSFFSGKESADIFLININKALKTVLSDESLKLFHLRLQ